MPSIYHAYDQVASLIAQLQPAALLQLRASSDMQQRFDFLVRKQELEGLSLEEKDELDHFIVLERLIRLAKIKADAYSAK